jgi:hypothetical protein
MAQHPRSLRYMLSSWWLMYCFYPPDPRRGDRLLPLSRWLIRILALIFLPLAVNACLTASMIMRQTHYDAPCTSHLYHCSLRLASSYMVNTLYILTSFAFVSSRLPLAPHTTASALLARPSVCHEHIYTAASAFLPRSLLFFAMPCASLPLHLTMLAAVHL